MRRRIRRGLPGIAGLLLVGGALGGATLLAPRPAAAEPELLDRVVAVVDDDIVLLSHLDRSVRSSPQLQEALQMLGPGATEQQLEQKLKETRIVVLDELIDTVLIKKEAAKFQITASEADIQRYLQQLAAGNNYPSVAELRKAVIASGEFGSWEEYRQDIRDQITVYKATSMLANWAVTEAQMREYYRKMARGEDARIEVDRFVFAQAGQGSGARDEAFARAQGIARRLRAGEASDAVIAELGGDPEEYRRTIARGEIAPLLEDALFPATTGEVVGPLASGQGYVVFRVVRHLASEVLSYEEAKEGIRQKLEADAYEKAEREFRQTLRSKAHIDIRL
ncbi:MAG: peptidyl-prolyl cis-trans isomerase [Myxococcales bacterium]|nr:peptidyl-prolyl cis-trans isomerase [Myxococcales bacterium]